MCSVFGKSSCGYKLMDLEFAFKLKGVMWRKLYERNRSIINKWNILKEVADAEDCFNNLVHGH